METTSSEIAGWRFVVDELDGHTLIETIWPETVEFATLSVPLAAYTDLWDDERRVVTLSDLTRLKVFPEPAQRVFTVFLRGLAFRPNHVSAAWYCGSNFEMSEIIHRLVLEMGGTGRGLYAKREDAIAYLRRGIARAASTALAQLALPE